MPHPNKHIREAVEYALSRGWRLKKTGRSSHLWGRLLCPFGARGGCDEPVYSTPRSPENHADRIRDRVDKRPHPPAG